MQGCAATVRSVSRLVSQIETRPRCNGYRPLPWVLICRVRSIGGVHGRIVTGEVADVAPDDGKGHDAKTLGAKGAKGGKVRASGMTPKQRAEMAKAAARKMATGTEK